MGKNSKTSPRTPLIGRIRGRTTFNRVALGLVAFILILNILLPSLFFGFASLTGTDEIRLFNRGKAIATGQVDIYHHWSQPLYIDSYPPGYSIIVAEILTIFPNADVYLVSYVMRLSLMAITLLSYLWLGLFISRGVALLSVFSRGTLFVVLLSNPEHYMYLFYPGVYLGGGIFTEICIIMTIVFALRYLKGDGMTHANLLIIFLLGLLHGLTHISGFLLFTIFFSASLIIIQLLFVRMSALREGLVDWLRAIAKSKISAIISVLFLLPLLVFLLYYLRILLEVDPEIYRIHIVLPLGTLPVSAYLASISSLFLLGALVLLLRGRGIHEAPQWKISTVLSQRNWAVAISAYLLCFAVIFVAVTRNPAKYDYSSFVVSTVFPSMLPLDQLNIVSLPSFFAGIALFVMSIVGIVFASRSSDFNTRFVMFLYLMSYYFFAVIFLVGTLMPHRAIFFRSLLPFVIALFLRGMIGSSRGPFLRSIFWPGVSTVKKIPRIVAVLIIVSLVVVAAVSRANMDPAVREIIGGDNPLQFGSLSPAIVTTDFIREVEKVHVPGTAILSTPLTQAALYAFLDMVPKVPSYSPEIMDNKLYADAYFSLNFVMGRTPADWLQRHNGSLVVIGYMDVQEGFRTFGTIPLKIGFLDDEALSGIERIYRDEYGQTIYRLKT